MPVTKIIHPNKNNLTTFDAFTGTRTTNLQTPDSNSGVLKLRLVPQVFSTVFFLKKMLDSPCGKKSQDVFSLNFRSWDRKCILLLLMVVLVLMCSPGTHV
uniref:Uncharacterized protein n=1 Tax=Cacopsylla melanoneura TaxID=428564 RepID=A0A8D8ZA62_9HEMI